MHWRLIIQKYSPEPIYLKSKTKIVTDTLSRLNIDSSQWVSNIHNCDLHLVLDDNDMSHDIFPLHYKLIAQHQTKQKDLLLKL